MNLRLTVALALTFGLATFAVAVPRHGQATEHANLNPQDIHMDFMPTPTCPPKFPVCH